MSLEEITRHINELRANRTSPPTMAKSLRAEVDSDVEESEPVPAPKLQASRLENLLKRAAELKKGKS